MIFFPLNLFKVGDLVLTVHSSYSLPVQGTNVIQQHHHFWRALKLLPAKTTEWILTSTFLLIPSVGSVLAQQMKPCPQRRESSSRLVWPQCPGVMPCREPCSLTSSCCWLSGGAHTSGVVLEQRCKRLMLCLSPQNGSVTSVSVLNIHVC